MRRNESGVSHNIAMLLIAVAFIILVGVFGWHFKGPGKVKKSNTQAQAAWVEYKSTKYGFKFSYPKDWGQPEVHSADLEPGKRYSIGFVQKSSLESQANRIFINMTTSDTKTPACSAPCLGTPTKEIIQKNLNSNTSFTKRSNDYYAIVSKDVEHGVQSSLTIDSLTKLDRINVDAAEIYFGINGKATSCPENNIVNDSNTDCINSTTYSEVTRVLRSLASL